MKPFPSARREIIRHSQQEFTKRKSCLTNLVRFYNKMPNLMDKGRAVDIVFLVLRNLMVFNKEKGKVLHLVNNAWGHPAGKHLCLGVLADTKLNMSQQHALTAKKADGIIGCIRQSLARRAEEAIHPFYSAFVKLHVECWVQFWAFQYKRNMDILHRKSPTEGF